ncbi:MAG: lipoyl synthase [Pseudomonadota bacterium]
MRPSRSIPITQITPADRLPKPNWIRIRAGGQNPERVQELKTLLREHKLATVCEEASCPNMGECFSKGTATFMILGDKCTRRCTFCDVAHGRPDPVNPEEAVNLAKAIAAMQLRYVVITSVDRDDLKDGGAAHFAHCIQETRALSPKIVIETLVPDFRGRMEKALDALSVAPPDVFNHNIETVPRLYRAARPGSDYAWSLKLIQNFKARFPHIPTKSGIMLGLGETDEEVMQVLEDLRRHDCDRVTIGQYLQPSAFHAPVCRYVTPEQFAAFKEKALELGFNNVASGPLVRSSYHADKQAAGETVV